MPKMPDFTKTTGRIYYRKNAAPANPVFLEKNDCFSKPAIYKKPITII